MPNLLELQRDMCRVLCEPDGAAAPWIAGDDARETLAIHRATILGTLVKALRLTFPTVERLVGAEFFEGAASLFARTQRPVAADLNVYGDGFPGFLRDLPQCAGLEYLPDVAHLDRAVALALHAPDERPLSAETLESLVVRAEQISFVAHPSVSLVRSPFPVHEIWRAVLASDDASLAALDLARGPVHLVVQRIAEEVELVEMEAQEWRFAEQLLSGVPLGRAMEAVDVDAAACIARHLTAGRIVGIASDHAKEGT